MRLFSLFKKNKTYRRDYALGLASALQAQELVKNGSYREAETLLQQQPLNDLTQIVDHLALSLEEAELLAWQEAEGSDYAWLVLGVYYLHMAWIARSHTLANKVSSKKADLFYDNLEQSEAAFEAIPENSVCRPEVLSRQVRLYMSFGDMSFATECFQRVSHEYPDFVWPYIHYAELIQPKWGGSTEAVLDFYEHLPDDFLLRSISELKLIYDALLMDDHYFEKYNPSLQEFATQKLQEIDSKPETTALSSVHRYILFNYMEVVANTLRKSSIETKYRKLSGDYYTLYPYGVTR